MITSGKLDSPSDEGRSRDNDEVRVIDGPGAVLYSLPPCAEIPGLIDDLCRFAIGLDDSFIYPIIKGTFLHFLTGYIYTRSMTGTGDAPGPSPTGTCSDTFTGSFHTWLSSRTIKDSKGR